MKAYKYKEKQINYYSKKWSEKKLPKITPVHSFFSTIALEKIVKLFPLKYKNKKVLIICGGGDGFEVRKMESLGANLTVSDLSPEALKEVKKNFSRCKVKVADAEELPFKTNSFDIGLVKDGLHHLISPEKGITELYRVCKEAILIIDFQESFITKFAKRVGFSPQYEDAGNPNFHFERKDLTRLFSEIGVKEYKISSLLLDARPFKFSFFNTSLGMELIKIIFSLSNLFFSRWGNILLVSVIVKGNDKKTFSFSDRK